MKSGGSFVTGWRQSRGFRVLGSVLLFTYIFASLLVGFAHRPLGLSGLEPFPGVGVLCLSGKAPDDGTPAAADTGSCDACLLTAAPGLTTPAIEDVALSWHRHAYRASAALPSRPRRSVVCPPATGPPEAAARHLEA